MLTTASGKEAKNAKITKVFCLLSFLVVTAMSANAALIVDSSDPSLTGATIEDFSAVPFQTVTSPFSLVVGDLTFTPLNENIQITNAYAGSYGMTGTSLQSEDGSSLRVEFARPVSALGFKFGAADYDWDLSGYDVNDNLLETVVLPGGSPYDYFYGLSANGISYILLWVSSLGDYIMIDNFHYVSGISFSLLPQTPNQAAILGFLNTHLATAGGDFYTDLATLSSLPDGEFQYALDELSPEPYAGLRDAGLRVVRAGTATVGERLNSLRLTKTAGIDGKLMYAAASEVMTDTGPASAVTNKSGFSLWARPYRYVADQDGKGSNFGYKHDFMGMTLGVDKAIGKNALFGIMVGKSSGDVDYSVVDAESDMESMYGGVYGAMTTGDLYLHTQAAYFKHEFDTTRELTFIGRTASSDHDADEFAASLGGEYLGISSPCGWNLVPGLAAEYSYYDEESFTESGAGSYDLDVDGETYDSLVSRLGVRVNKAFKQERTVLIPELKLEWAHEYLETDRDVKATFAGAGAGCFKVEGVDAEDDTFVVGVGLTGVMDETSAFYVNYDNEFASDYSMWGVSFGYKYSF